MLNLCLNSAILLPPGGQFWTQCASHLINMMQPGGALYGVDGGLARNNGPAHGHGSIIGAALGAALFVEERFENH